MIIELMPRERGELTIISTKCYDQLEISHNYKTIAQGSMTSDYMVQNQVTG